MAKAVLLLPLRKCCADQLSLLCFPAAQALLEFARIYAEGKPVYLRLKNLPTAPPANEKQIALLEAQHKIVTLWLWLSLRFEAHAFPGREEVLKLNSQVIGWINRGLEKSAAKRVDKHAAAAAAAIAAEAAETDAAAEAAGAQEHGAAAARAQPAAGETADWQHQARDWLQSQAVPPELHELYDRDVLRYIRIKSPPIRLLLPKSGW